MKEQHVPQPATKDDGDSSDEPITYGSYLKVPELLTLQQPLVGERAHDEMLFIVIHQAYELWFRQLLHELEEIISHILCGDLREAARLLERVREVETLLVQQMHLLESMTPRDFASFRSAIRPASGFESMQFREVEFLTGLKDERLIRVHPEGSPERARLQRRLKETDLRQALFTRLRAEGLAIPENAEFVDPADEDVRQQIVKSLIPVYVDYEDHWEIYRVCEGLLSHDQWILTWRFHHIRVVERIIGFKQGTGGSPGVKYLERTLRKRAFDVLVEARTHMDDDALFAGYRSPSC